MPVQLINQPKNKITIDKSEVLTNLDFLNEGQPWPPSSQMPRLNRYRLNKSKFDNKLNINQKAYKYILNVINDRFRVVSYRMLINIYRKVSYKTADLLFVERPNFVTTEDSQKTLTEIVDLSKLAAIGYEGALDTSYYGDVVFTIKIPSLASVDGEESGEAEQGKARTGITNPAYWFPVVSERDLKEIKHHVLAHVVTRLVEDKDGKDIETNFLIYQIHEKGKYTVGERAITDEGNLGEKTVVEEGAKEVINTGLSDFAVVPTYGVTTSASIFGIDDYTDIINLVDELQIRMEKIAGVLDKHSDPSLSGPSSALMLDENGEYVVKLGGFFARETKESPAAEYLTWDGKLEPSFKEIELILRLLSILTEMGPAIFDDEEGGGGDISGRALRLKYVRPLTKVARLRNNFDDAFKHALSLCSEVGYSQSEGIPEKEISIEWNDGLPDDPKELAEIGQIRTGKPTDTTTAQIMIQDGLNQEQAEKKTAEIEAEQAAEIPGLGLPGNFDPDALLGGDPE